SRVAPCLPLRALTIRGSDQRRRDREVLAHHALAALVLGLGLARRAGSSRRSQASHARAPGEPACGSAVGGLRSPERLEGYDPSQAVRVPSLRRTVALRREAFEQA